jgi:hypothetical protein
MAVDYSLIMALYICTSTTRPRQLLRRGSDRAPSLAAFLADCPSSHAGGQGKGWIYFHQTSDGVLMSQFSTTEPNLPVCETFTSSITHDLKEPGQATEIGFHHTSHTQEIHIIAEFTDHALVTPCNCSIHD